MFTLPISCHWSLSIPTESFRKPLVFWCFQGVYRKRLVVCNGLSACEQLGAFDQCSNYFKTWKKDYFISGCSMFNVI